MTWASFTHGSAAAQEFQNRFTEMEATRLAKTGDIKETDPFVLDVSAAKKPYKPLFGFDKLKPKVTPGDTRMKGVTLDYTPDTYQTMTEEPVTDFDIALEKEKYGVMKQPWMHYDPSLEDLRGTILVEQ